MPAILAALFTPQGFLLLAVIALCVGIGNAVGKKIKKVNIKTDDLVTIIETRDSLNRQIDTATRSMGWFSTRILNRKLKKRGLLT